MVVLDTDVMVLLQQGHTTLAAEIQAYESLIVTTSVTQAEILVARAEYLLKASDSAQLLNAQYWFDRSLELLRSFVVLPMDADAMVHFERLRKVKGIRKVGRADLLIASITLAHRATLITRNTRDFRLIPGLAIENWAD